MNWSRGLESGKITHWGFRFCKREVWENSVAWERGEERFLHDYKFSKFWWKMQSLGVILTLFSPGPPCWELSFSLGSIIWLVETRYFSLVEQYYSFQEKILIQKLSENLGYESGKSKNIWKFVIMPKSFLTSFSGYRFFPDLSLAESEASGFFKFSTNF